VQSFDFYDTLFVRSTGRPTDIFRVMEERLASPGFAGRRIAAELSARRRSGKTEVTLAGIYADPALHGIDAVRAMALEQELERELIAPVSALIGRVKPGDIVVSDMYLPGDVLRDIVSRHMVPAPAVVISSETGRSKSAGTQWPLLKARFPHLHVHNGDNKHSDVVQPRRHGLRATHVRETEFNRYERSWLQRADLDSSLIAGLSRATRLASDAGQPGFEHHAAVFETFASVIAPLLVAFVEHVLHACQADGIRHIAFLARDGQLPLRIAERLARARGLDVQLSYLYGSRHALHLPGYVDIDQAESWLLEDTTHLTLADIAARGDLPIRLIEEAARRHGYDDIHADIPRSQRASLRNMLRESSIQAALRERADAKWANCHHYFAQAGLQPGEHVALVDVGWTGRMQASLRRILDRAQTSPVKLTGHYLGLVSKLVTSPHDQLRGYLHDPDHDVGPCPLKEYRGLIETALAADHATTLGFRRGNDGSVAPELARGVQRHADLATRQQAVVLRFVDLMLKSEQSLGRRIQWPKDVVSRHLRWMLEYPTTSDARAFAGHSHFQGQGDGQEGALVAKLPLGPKLLRWRALGLWPEGTYRLSGAGRLLFAMNAARRVKALLSSALAS
jgi:predicted HAD superfamily hydrolase